MPRYAAVDIGSNSVRMVAAEVAGGQTKILAEDREVTRLGESVFRSGQISAEAFQLLLTTLSRMAGIYSKLDVAGIRAVATSAVRDASNQHEFLQRTSNVLGTSVEIISGPEEARLIHLGVESRWPRSKELTLIIDVGGGSAELIISRGSEIVDAVSKPLGAVRLTEMFLKSDPPTPVELDRLNGFISEKLQPFWQEHADKKFDRAIATSASAAAVICSINQIPRAKRDEADRARASTRDIRSFFSAVASSSLAQRKRMVGVGPRRAEIIVAGAAIFLRTLERFQHPSLFYSSAGVRDGIIADLAARGVGLEASRLTDQQRSEVEWLAEKYSVNLNHARQVAFLAGRLFDILEPVHRLPPAAGKLLEAAALVHDIGHFVSGTSHHKHSAYLVANSDLPGFTNRERLAVASLCRFHRKSLPQAKKTYFDELDADAKRMVFYLTPLLRLADSLDRGHEAKIKDVSGRLKDNTVQLSVSAANGTNLEIWAANEAARAFREVYSRALTVQRVQAQTA
ncbi:MAG: HD domain-containing protein [Bryobacteraceae bacterium]